MRLLCIAALLVVVAAAVGCRRPLDTDETTTTLASIPERKDLDEARQTTVVDQTTLSLNATVLVDDRRNADEKGIQVSAMVSAFAGGTFPATVSLAELYVVRGDEVWNVVFDEERVLGSTSHDGIARQGPVWPVGTPVDVIVALNELGKPTSYVAVRGSAVAREAH